MVGSILMARKRRNPQGHYFDGGRGQMVHFDYVRKHEGPGGKETYLLPDGTWLSGVRKGHGNLLKRRTTKLPPKWVKLPNSPKEVARADYPAIFGDSDKDTIPDVDDPHPFRAGDTKSIEEVRLSDEIGALIDTRQHYTDANEEVMRRLRSLQMPGSKVEGRVKTPFSTINKLRRKRLRTLTDMAGARIVLNDQAAVDSVVRLIDKKKPPFSDVDVLEKEDFYKEPQAGYRAVHYILKLNGVPVEVQIKTWRMGMIAKASHTPYKTGKLDAEKMEEVTALAEKADRGDKEAARQVDKLIRKTPELTRMLTRVDNPRLQRLARRMANGY